MPKIVEFVLEEHITEIENSIKNQGDEQREDLQKKSKVISRILSSVAGPFLNDINDAGCKEVLKAFMDFPSITAVLIMDEDGQPFAAAWKAPDITIGSVISDNIKLNAKQSLQIDVVHEENLIGKITVYYSDKILTEKLSRDRDQALSKVGSFRKTVNERIETAVFNQAVAVIFIILSLIATISTCLKSVVIKPLNRVVDNLRDIAKGEGDLTVRLNIKSGNEIGALGKWFDKFTIGN